MPFLNTKIAEYAKRLTKLKGTEDKIFKIVLDNVFIKELIKHLNTEEQLRKERVDSLGARLGTYSQFDPKGRGGNFISLFDTGEFYDSWIVRVNEQGILLDANPFKTGEDGQTTNLFDRYGIDVLGLTERSLQILRDESTRLFIEYHRKNTLPNN